MADDRTYVGRCFCGAVELAVTGEPEIVGYCHCSSCRGWAAAPVNAFTLWQRDKVQITKGADNIGSYSKSPQIERRWCKTCGGHLLTNLHHWQLVDVYAAVIPTFSFEPSLHVHYQETVLPLKDGLPKQKDFPKELGGSGTLLRE
jgi:hypothetical protein